MYRMARGEPRPDAPVSCPIVADESSNDAMEM